MEVIKTYDIKDLDSTASREIVWLKDRNYSAITGDGRSKTTGTTAELPLWF